MVDERVHLAARNNALWCSRVCRAHGDPGRFGTVSWSHVQATPRYYPNAVTLDPRPEPTMAELSDVLGSRSAGGFSIKDSFATLELTALGARVLFDASWLFREAAETTATVRWSRARSEAELADWEHALQRATEDAAPARVFLPTLLADPDVALLSWRGGTRGAIAYRGAGVIGLCNVFATDSLDSSLYEEAAAGASLLFPGLPVVGYEHGAALRAALAAGFVVIGALRIWLR